jgi:hypothetical protein
VGVAVPIQRHPPALVLTLSLVELAAFVVLIATANLAALLLLAVAAAGLLVVAATNRHRILAITSSGVVLLVASAGGKPLAAIGPAPDDLALPDPAGVGAPVELAGSRWWVDRASFPRLRRARELLRGGSG